MTQVPGTKVPANEVAAVSPSLTQPRKSPVVALAVPYWIQQSQSHPDSRRENTGLSPQYEKCQRMLESDFNTTVTGLRSP